LSAPGLEKIYEDSHFQVYRVSETARHRPSSTLLRTAQPMQLMLRAIEKA